jgi:signal transduction histidine kinase
MSDGFGARARALVEAEAAGLGEHWLRTTCERRAQRGTALPSYADHLARDEVVHMLFIIAPELAGARSDAEALRGHVRRYAQIRYAQGFNAEDVDAEIDRLAAVVFDAVAALCDGGGSVSALEALAVARRIASVFERLGQDAARSVRESHTSDSLQRAALLDDFGRAVTHELRNRLNPITLSLALLEQPGLRQTSTETVLARLKKGLRRVESVVPDVFAVAVARGRADGDGEHRLPLSEVVRQTLTDMAELSETSHVELSTGPMSDVAVDPVRVSLVLINLLSNAIKYRDPEKQVRTVHVSCTLEHHDGEYVVRVSDNGIGIAQSLVPQVFERYVRGSHELVSGEGIGLALAKKAVRQLGGRIWVESAPGLGSTFAFTLPDPGSVR